ncbi:MAG: hypothetical protein BGO82_09975 [Devosia sp. 67-54]|uniref:hypothetical protein n=1 Tax=unclassified Devosia TaxID=196773 RepID=UPI00095FC789|nr:MULTISPECIES: hypothetical protein [unclassified Devosia]MBN9305038.1 hypothetical protein [Devosia sp.]OJX15021.1 MAG: hypothetical protein BGO82_09975 [Devosia sp. 67-54]
MPSATYELFLAAMRGRRQIVCLYQGHRRELCPILLGRTGLEEKCLAYQFGGDTSAGRLPAAGEWKCLKLRDVRDAVLRDGPWRSGAAHSTAQTCMKMVEYDVNPASPYHPVFRL